MPPSLVAQRIVEIAESGTWQLRHPVGPDASPFLQWRSQMTDEEWVDLNASDDETWYSRLKRDFGLDARPREPGPVNRPWGISGCRDAWFAAYF